MNTVKSPGDDVTVREPLCALVMRLAMARPRPVPPVLYVVNGSKISSRCSCGIPQPLSEIFTQTEKVCPESSVKGCTSRRIFR